MTAVILQGDARSLPLPDASVDLIVTSPPYFGLRSYTDGGHHYQGQIGSEATPADFIAALVDCTREWMRVLKPSGSMFINLGDKYTTTMHSYNYRDPGTYTRKTPQPDGEWSKTGRKGQPNLQPAPQDPGLPPKCLMGLPWRYAHVATDQLGLILRAEIIWAKPNGLPESVTDRVRRAHEQVFHLVKQPRYYAAVDEIREPHTGNAHPAGPRAAVTSWESGKGVKHRTGRTDLDQFNPLGKLPGSVWTIPSAPLTVPPTLGVDHFAAFPPALVRPPVLAYSPDAICVNCGFLLGSSYDDGMLGVRRPHHRRTRQDRNGPAPSTGKQPLLLQEVLQSAHGQEPGIHQVPPSDHAGLRGGLEARASNGQQDRLPDGTPADHGRAGRTDAGTGRGRASPQRGQDGQPAREPGTTGQGPSRPATQATTAAVRMSPLRRTHPHRRESIHACPHCGSDQFRPSVVVDPFSGTGTTPLVAAVHGRTGIGIDLSHDYCRLARWRCNDPGERARALNVPKPPPVPDDQTALF